MPTHIAQQTIEYMDRVDDIDTITRALDLMKKGDYAGASRVLVVYLHFLQDGQKPVVKDYDPRADMAKALSR